jgi:hypothetical protein
MISRTIQSSFPTLLALARFPPIQRPGNVTNILFAETY